MLQNLPGVTGITPVIISFCILVMSLPTVGEAAFFCPKPVSLPPQGEHGAALSKEQAAACVFVFGPLDVVLRPTLKIFASCSRQKPLR